MGSIYVITSMILVEHVDVWAILRDLLSKRTGYKNAYISGVSDVIYITYILLMCNIGQYLSKTLFGVFL